MNPTSWDDIAQSLHQKTPQQILAFAIAQFDNIAVSFSGAEDVVLIDMATKIKSDIKVFSLDTGRLHPETYQFIDRVRTHYKIEIKVLYPEATAVSELVSQKGFFSFYQDNHNQCCEIRKIAPLRSHLLTLDAWITGQRKDQNPGTRGQIPIVQNDSHFARPNDSLAKFNPLANWTLQDVWNYIRAYEVPFNPLHEKGYVSIGCEPCTKAIGPGQHEREGRWWWEDATKKECGLHLINVQPDS
jgi:phosphoadenosine phosphosulfate reductase